MTLTGYFWRLQWEIALWECCFQFASHISGKSKSQLHVSGNTVLTILALLAILNLWKLLQVHINSFYVYSLYVSAGLLVVNVTMNSFIFWKKVLLEKSLSGKKSLDLYLAQNKNAIYIHCDIAVQCWFFACRLLFLQPISWTPKVLSAQTVLSRH